MKKALLSLLLGLVAMPMAFGQTFSMVDTTMCSPLKWSVDNHTYTRDTTVVISTDTAIYVLRYTRPTLVLDTAGAPVEVMGECVATLNNHTWTTPGTFFDTVLESTPAACKVKRVHVTLAITDSVETIAACGEYTAPWGDTYTASTQIDTTVVHGDCTYPKHLTLTVNPVYPNHDVTVTAECEYIWNGQTIRDFEVHTDTLATVAGGCDSIVSLSVTAYTGIANENIDIVACDTFLTASRIATWIDTVTTSGFLTYDTNYGTYPLTDSTTEVCQHHITMNFNIVASNHDTNSIVPEVIAEAACSYSWASQTITDTLNHFHVFRSVIGGCDSVAGIRVAHFTGMKYDTTVVEHCGTSYDWTNSAFTGISGYNNGFRFTHDTVATVEVVDSVAHCTTLYTLDLSFYIKYDTIKNRRVCGTSYSLPTSQYKVRNHTTGAFETPRNVPPFTESGLYDVNGNGDTMYYVSNGCATQRALQLELKIPEQRYRSTDTIPVSACDQYLVILDGLPVTTLRNNCDTSFTVENHVDYFTCYDSIAFLSLTIRKSSIDTLVVDTCNSYFWTVDSTLYTSSVTKSKRHSVKNAVGCDSVSRLNLTINYSPVVNITGNWVLAPGDNTILYAEPDMAISNYAWYVNDVLTQQGRTADSLILNNVQSNLDVRLQSTSTKGCSSTSWITVSANVGIDEVDGLQAVVYPNPTSRYLHIESAEGISEAIVYNAVGQQVIVRSGEGTHLQLDLGNLGAGSYSLRIMGRDGQQTVRKFIVNK